jgi:hypothetical protein
VELAHPVVEVLAQPVAVAHELAQGLGARVVQLGGRGALWSAPLRLDRITRPF